MIQFLDVFVGGISLNFSECSMAEEYLFEVGRLCATGRHCLGLMNTVSSVTKVENSY